MAQLINKGIRRLDVLGRRHPKRMAFAMAALAVLIIIAKNV